MQPGQDVLPSLLRASARSWRLSDGRGALSRGTASGAATRRAHALLAAPQAGPHAAWPAVSLLRFDDRVRLAEGGQVLELTPAFMLAQRPGSTPVLTARAGSLASCESFAETPWPRWRFRGDGWLLEREYRLIEDHPALLASWRLLEGGPLQIHVAPLLVARSLEGLQAETPEFRGAVTGIPGRVRCLTVEGYAPLTLWHGGAFMPARAWQRGLAYPYDGQHDLDDPDAGAATPGEDAFLPGWVQCPLPEPGVALHIVASPEEHLFRTLASEQRLGTPPVQTLAECLAVLDLAEGERRGKVHDTSLAGAARTARQAAAAHAGPAKRAAAADAPEKPAVRAKASPPPVATAEVATIGDAVEPMEPEPPADVVPAVGALAARLHGALFERADRTSVLTNPARMLERGPDALRVAAGLVTLRAFGPARDIARGYLMYLDEGLAPEAFDGGGYPHYGSPEASLWLVHLVDLIARRDGGSEATKAFLEDGAYAMLEGVLHHLRSGSRHGVRCDADGFLWHGEDEEACTRADLNALWYHALAAMSQLAKLMKRRENAAFYMAWARELQRAYADRFWDEQGSCLYDEVAAEGPLRSLSPSQLYAVALPPVLLTPDLALRLVDTVTRELFDARGLRPRPGDGAPDPVWLGPWAAATLRSHGRDRMAGRRVRAALEQYARIGEADALELDARAAAELVRTWVEEIDHAAPSAAMEAAHAKD
jgi:glycogen debranching enzyme-like protein/amylo-alpha-1,6-glucosidase